MIKLQSHQPLLSVSPTENVHITIYNRPFMVVAFDKSGCSRNDLLEALQIWSGLAFWGVLNHINARSLISNKSRVIAKYIVGRPLIYKVEDHYAFL